MLVEKIAAPLLTDTQSLRIFKSSATERAMQVYKTLNGRWVVLLSAITGKHDDKLFDTKEAAEKRMKELKAAQQ
jgi:hypothetical protein